MVMVDTLADFLVKHRVAYELQNHQHSGQSLEVVAQAHLSPREFAKAVVIDVSGVPVMVVVQAVDHVDFAAVHHYLGEKPGLWPQDQLASLFPGCADDAIPAVGAPWGMRTLIDVDLLKQPQMFVEAGDHEHLLRFEADQFERLQEQSERGHFSHIL